MQQDFRIGDWLVQPLRDVIESPTGIAQLEPKAMDLLVYLARHPGQVLPKERLIQAVWPDAFVTDEVLTNTIWKLRQAFGDDPRNPTVIQTVPRRGYQLIAEVAFQEEEEESSDRYQILKELARRPMGQVHLARDSYLERDVALKFLSTEMEEDDALRRRLFREARAAAALDHPFICKVYDTGKLEGRTFIALEYVEGNTLKHRLEEGNLALKEALRLAVEVAEALESAHEKNIVHRDIKPSNIMITAQGHVKVMDFGVAKRLPVPGQNQDWTSTLTVEALSMGTLPYMSPEQVKCQHVDTRSDQFSFGVVLYEMLTGIHPFRRPTTAETMSALLTEDPPPPSHHAPEIPIRLEQVVKKLLQKDRELRYASIAEVRLELQRIITEPGSSGRWIPSWRKVGMSLAAIFGFLLIASLFWPFLFPPVAELPPFKRIPFTSEEGQEGGAAFSPDGKRLAYSWTESTLLGDETGSNLYISPVRGTGRRQVTNHPGYDRYPVWSPDGLNIAFLRYYKGESAVYTISTEGTPGQERKLIPLNDAEAVWCGLSWSPDGAKLVFSDRETPQQPWSLYLFTMATHKAERLTHPPGGSGLPRPGDQLPEFSPDGRYLAFTRRGKEQGLHVVPAEGGEPRRLTAQDSLGLAWTRDSREIVFPHAPGTFFLEGGPLWRIPIDDGVPQLIPELGESATGPAISTHGNLLVFSQYSFDSDIWKMPLAPSDTDAEKVVGSTREDACPSISPDGKRIAFVSRRSGDREVWLCNSDGTGMLQLTQLGGLANLPSWSPDGRRLAFTYRPKSLADAATPQIYVVDSAGGLPGQVTENGGFNPSWSRDGNWIYYSFPVVGGDVWKIPAEGGEAVQMTQEQGESPVESSDGASLYYVKVIDQTWSLWRMPVQGGVSVRIFEMPFPEAWHVGAKGLYYVNFREKPPELEFFDFGTQESTMISQMPGNLMKVDPQIISVSPDESWLTYVTEELDLDLVMVENFR